ncbi:hypothetical protein DBR39_17715 [Chryseobacterium sp. KBW03]|uniref:hypothetical protein n=1 Tax=Chryseobacterium sp. KBW03 TaxID=2153362 RepID=UPI000F5A6908|nr:hypothetical protein [Chryseobacterium sp. KBW03]RQO35533.1 hypothetical protein DBR39_17715 [Chryseobacterium sp. KBW03]
MNIQLILFNVILGISSTSCMHQNNRGNNEANITSEVQKQRIEKIQLTERTRGFSKSIVLTSASKMVNTNEVIDNSKTAPSEWKNISKLAESISLSKIADLPSPTTGRHSDRALAATIIITSNGTDYTSGSFDSGYPPKELEALYNAIMGTQSEKKAP